MYNLKLRCLLPPSRLHPRFRRKRNKDITIFVPNFKKCNDRHTKIRLFYLSYLFLRVNYPSPKGNGLVTAQSYQRFASPTFIILQTSLFIVALHRRVVDSTLCRRVYSTTTVFGIMEQSQSIKRPIIASVNTSLQ